MVERFSGPVRAALWVGLTAGAWVLGLAVVYGLLMAFGIVGH